MTLEVARGGRPAVGSLGEAAAAGKGAARVLMTADAVGGVWTYALDLARGLSATGVEVVLAVMGPALDRAQRAEAAAVTGLTLVDTGLPLDWLARDARAIDEVAEAVADLARFSAVDLVHLNSPALARPMDIPVVGVCHSCVATWWSAVRRGPMPEDFRWRTEALRAGLAHCDVLIAPSAAFADAVAATYEAARPLVVHNGRRPLGGPDMRRERSVFTAGRLWDGGKNLATLDAAAALLDAPVFAAGPVQGPHGERVDLRRLRLLGKLEPAGVRRALASSRVFASVALYEPFGLSVLEAAQAGCPLVLSDIPTFRELWSGVAEFVPPHDHEALAAACRRLLDDPREAEVRGAAARARAARYTVEAMRAGVLAAYEAVAPGITPTLRREAAA